MTTPRSPRRSFVVRFYRALLFLLPADMRDRDAAEIEALFADELSAARSSGLLAQLWFAIASALDIARRAPYEHWRRRGRRPNEESTMRSFIAQPARRA